jgi:hypothetical protein
MIIHGHATGSVRNLLEPLFDCPVHLRWGGDFVPGAINGQAHLLNGLEQLQAFRAAGVACPDFTTDLQTARDWSQSSIVLGRLLNHTQGKDIISIAPLGQMFGKRRGPRRTWNDSDFWVRYALASVEWRFHIVNGQSIGRGLKSPSIATHTPRPGEPTIRSRRLGWVLDHTQKPPEAARELAKAACAAVGYDLAAVDLLQLAGKRQFMVLECNSRPAIRDRYTIAAYAKALRALEPTRNGNLQ